MNSINTDGDDGCYFTTKSGTIMLADVEYGTYPPPSDLVKVMKSCRAKQFVAYGTMRFRILEYYRHWENSVLGDPNDGISLFHLEGNPCTGDTVNPVYAWCSSLTVITPDRIQLIAQYGGYDCLVRVGEPSVLIQRAHSALLATDLMLALYCSEVTYNRGIEVNKNTLNSQKFHFNIVQKDPKFVEDKEYRLAIIDTSTKFVPKDYIDLQIGDCSDILIVEDLPTIPCRVQ